MVQSPVPEAVAQTETETMYFSVFFFSANEAEFDDEKYKLLFEATQFADRHGYKAVWTPERHFHTFGGLYPNPATLSAALSQVTQQIRLCSGSVVLSLHSPILVAEEWALVDNLSQGRVDLAFTVGWNPNDFVLMPDNYQEREAVTFNNIDIIADCGDKEAVTVPNGNGEETSIRIYPRPMQQELPIWLTCIHNPQRFVDADPWVPMC